MSIKITSTISGFGALAACLTLAACGPTPAPASNAAPAAAPTPAVQAAAKPADVSRLTPRPPGREMQVSGCELRGKAFGVLAAGGDITFDGVRYEVERASGVGNQVIYTGPKVRAVFTPGPGGKIEEDKDGLPVALAPSDPAGTVRIEVAGQVVSTAAREHCIIFE